MKNTLCVIPTRILWTEVRSSIAELQRHLSQGVVARKIPKTIRIVYTGMKSISIINTGSLELSLFLKERQFTLIFL